MPNYLPLSLDNGLLPTVFPTVPNRQDLLNYTGDNTVQSARYINPLTQDFQLNTTGQLLGQNATDQSVFLALTTTFNTSSVAGLGNNFNRNTLPVIGPNINIQMQNILNQSLRSLINAGLISIVSVSVLQTGPNQMSISFVYRNVSSGQNKTVNFTLNNGVLSNG